MSGDKSILCPLPNSGIQLDRTSGFTQAKIFPENLTRLLFHYFSYRNVSSCTIPGLHYQIPRSFPKLFSRSYPRSGNYDFVYCRKPTYVAYTGHIDRLTTGMLRPRGRHSASASLFLASASISASRHLASQKLASWSTVHMTLINIHNIAIDNHFCCVLVAYWKLCSEGQYLSLHAHTHWVVL